MKRKAVNSALFVILRCGPESRLGTAFVPTKDLAERALLLYVYTA